MLTSGVFYEKTRKSRAQTVLPQSTIGDVRITFVEFYKGRD